MAWSNEALLSLTKSEGAGKKNQVKKLKRHLSAQLQTERIDLTEILEPEGSM